MMVDFGRRQAHHLPVVRWSRLINIWVSTWIISWTDRCVQMQHTKKDRGDSSFSGSLNLFKSAVKFWTSSISQLSLVLYVLLLCAGGTAWQPERGKQLHKLVRKCVSDGKGGWTLLENLWKSALGARCGPSSGTEVTPCMTLWSPREAAAVTNSSPPAADWEA